MLTLWGVTYLRSTWDNDTSMFHGGAGQVLITQNVAGFVPEFSTYVYMLTLLSALTIMYYFGRAKKLTV